MHLKKYLSIFLIAFAFAVAGCSSSDSSGGISDNDQAPDTDGDGIINDNDLDIDGDGILNKDDTDIDGDGTPNAGDENPNGGPGVTPPNPDAPCTSADIIVPSNEKLTGQTDVWVKWDLLPDGCGLTEERNVRARVTATNDYAEPATTESQNKPIGSGKAKIDIPNNCDWKDGTRNVTYDFKAIGTALGDPQVDAPGKYTQTVNHPVGQGTCENVEKDPVVPLNRISHHSSAQCDVDPSTGELDCYVSDEFGQGGSPTIYFYVWTRITKGLSFESYVTAPRWDIYTDGGDGKSYMSIALVRCDGSCSFKRVAYKGTGQAEWDALVEENDGWDVQATWSEVDGLTGWINRPAPGNFILKIDSNDTEIRNYYVPAP
ncbi:hypothetical protein OAI08_11155 [Gammaproteobacteria bacterium]|nr:hypothetical protein [Gammaproteobacteria bacterium]